MKYIGIGVVHLENDEEIAEESKESFSKLQDILNVPQPGKVKIISEENEAVIGEFNTISEAMAHVTIHNLENVYIPVPGMGQLRKHPGMPSGTVH
jgi:hypothetical protein